MFDHSHPNIVILTNLPTYYIILPLQASKLPSLIPLGSGHLESLFPSVEDMHPTWTL